MKQNALQEPDCTDRSSTQDGMDAMDGWDGVNMMDGRVDGQMGWGAQVLQGCILVGSAMGGLSAAPECALIDEHKKKGRSSSCRSWAC